MNSIELFAGVGGLAMGVANAGFEHKAVIEWNSDSCATIRENQRRRVGCVNHWPLYQTDVRDFDYADIGEPIDLLAGGPPCQPFSLGGKHKGYNDQRDMFPEVVRAVRELRPRAVLVENVKGLTRPMFANYFQYICLQLGYPDLMKNPDEEWPDHLRRLAEHHSSGRSLGLTYQVLFAVLNAADYGVPQRRERIFIVGIRTDLGIEWSFPQPTHSQTALLRDQWGTGEYWDKHRVAGAERPPIPARVNERFLRMSDGALPSTLSPWRTVRDAISDLPDPTKPDWSDVVANHRLNPGARVYPGHTGSPLDEPAKTLKAGDHGVPGGENMLAYPDGRVRYFTTRESARLQTFPDDYVFHSSWTESMRQLGNAVPVELGQMMATNIEQSLRRLEDKDLAQRRTIQPAGQKKPRRQRGHSATGAASG